MSAPQIIPTPRTQAALQRATGSGDALHQVIQESETMERELRAERQKLRTAREALASIEEQWWANHETNMFHGGTVMFTLAKNARAATGDFDE